MGYGGSQNVFIVQFSVTNVTLEGDFASYARTIFWQAGINASSTKPGGMSH
jgi:hypothetical protein